MKGKVEVTPTSVTVDDQPLSNVEHVFISVSANRDRLPEVTVKLVVFDPCVLFVGEATLKFLGPVLTDEDHRQLAEMWQSYADIGTVAPEDAKWLLERFHQLLG